MDQLDLVDDAVLAWLDNCNLQGSIAGPRGSLSQRPAVCAFTLMVSASSCEQKIPNEAVK